MKLGARVLWDSVNPVKTAVSGDQILSRFRLGTLNPKKPNKVVLVAKKERSLRQDELMHSVSYIGRPRTRLCSQAKARSGKLTQESPAGPFF